MSYELNLYALILCRDFNKDSAYEVFDFNTESFMRLTFIHFYRLALIGAMAIVTWQSLLPSNGLQGVPHIDKVFHFFVYGLLCFLAIQSRFTHRFLWPFLGVVAFGLLIEILQGAMGWGRTASVWDMLANTIGATLMLGLCTLFVKRRRSGRRHETP